ncbi:YihY/virulence factor BrkB family protein [Desulfobulbus sp.]|uniref:YihY/virulence factor BrkB family protein n=1 Tax=Desulfobulbus sp. TaxID=895 RepID=UPI0027B924D3|nr:YihY/virulence factor BrkB family protein [Desulfobulbus sp.]
MIEPAGDDHDAHPKPESAAVVPLPRRRRLRSWAFSPTPDPHGAGALARFCVRLLLIMRQEFFRTHLALRASALTYSIILSLVPILALSTSILKGLGNDEQLKTAVVKFIDQWEPPPAAVDPPETATNTVLGQADLPVSATTPVPTPASPTTTNLHHAVDLIFQYVDRTNFAALGIIGVIGLIGVVFLVLSSIEEAMNAIWHTHKGRSLFRKIMDYLALLILLPLSLNVALAAEAILANQTIMLRLSMILPSAWMAGFFIKLIPFLFIVLSLMVMYLFFPHCKVKTGPALVGALFASVFWFIFQKLYITLQVGVANYNAIYGSFASIPLFLIWLQIGWTFILLGASLAYALQHHHHYQFGAATTSPQKSLQLAVDVLHAVYEDFDARRATALSSLAQRLPQAGDADLSAVIALLRKGGLLRTLDRQTEEMLIPATPADKLLTREVVQLVLGKEVLPTLGGRLATRTIDAASNVANWSFSKITLMLGDHETAIAPDHSQNTWQQ